MEQSRIDWPSFVACVVIILGVCIPLALFSDWAGVALQSLYDFIAREFGIAYLLASVAAIGFLTWLAASRFGNIKLGDDRDEPEFGQLSWVAMLFCAGVGAGLMYWCVTEWAYYYQSPPFGVEAIALAITFTKAFFNSLSTPNKSICRSPSTMKRTSFCSASSRERVAVSSMSEPS